MTRIRILLFSICMAVMGTAMANQITEAQARELAAQFMARQSRTIGTASRASLKATMPTSGKAAFYVFNTSTAGKGYVIIAGDDRLPTVLGYSDSGSIDAGDVPPALQEWLDGYAAQVEAIAAGAAPEARNNISRPAIEPLVHVRWSQGMPYNRLLPHVNGSENAHAYVGCVAVAMAQIMAYWQYPSRATQTLEGYTSYPGRTYELTMPSLQPVDFEWDLMQDTYYINDSTTAAANAVATLMLYSTTSLKSSFGLTATGSFTRYIPDRLINYFGYKNSARYIYRESFSTEGWEDVIYAELAAGRPVAYGGNKQSSGHAFVCDGYDGEGRFHINWGWNGKSNGYFLLNLLNPSDEGIGSAAGAYGYVLGQGAAIGLEPAGDTTGTPEFTFEDLSINSSNTTRSSASSAFSVSVSGKFVNNTNATAQFRQGWGLFSLDGELLEVLFTRYSTSAIGPEGYISVSSRALSFGAGMTSGTYRIKPIYSIYPSEDYKPCVGSDVNYIEVTISGIYSCSIKGYGTAGSSTKYTVNSCTTQGTLNHGKPVTVNLNLTNGGTSTNDMVYMFVNGEFTAMGLAGINAGETGDIIYRFTPTTAGTKTLTFSLNESGSSPFYTKSVTINTMPSATLDVSYRILGITDSLNRIMTADCYSIIADITNTGTEAYDEDFSVRLYRINNDDTNVGTELLSQTQPLYLPAGASTSLQFDFDHDLIDGWKYFSYLYYYSAGSTVGLGTKWYQLNLTNTGNDSYAVTTGVTPAQSGIIRLTGGVVGSKAKAGNTVTFAVQPNTGYTLNTVSVVTASGEPIDFALDTAEGIYSFVMPEEAVSIQATFDEIPVYSITASASPVAGGNFSVSANSASAGETITVTTSPNVGWQCDGVTVTSTAGSPVQVNGSQSGYTFVMPEGDVTITANFVRSTGSLFELVDARANITEGGTYVLVSRNYDKVMKHWSEGDATFQADDVVAWLGNDQTIARVSDESGFFTMTQVADTTISTNTRTAAYLSTGNGYLRTSNYNVLQQPGIVAESRAWMYIGNSNNCLIRFKDSSSGSNGNWIVRYDNADDNFKVMNWNVTGAEVSRVWLYKLVESYAIVTNCNPELGTIAITGGTMGTTAQRGETVTFTVTPGDGCTLTAVNIATTGGEAIAPVLDENSGVYSFIMPGDDVTINAELTEPSTPEYIRGDVNGDQTVNIKDVTDLIDYLLSGYSDGININGADCSEDNAINIKDVTDLIDYLLSGSW